MSGLGIDPGCVACSYWRVLPRNPGKGRCHLNPPIAEHGFIITPPDYSCGQHSSLNGYVVEGAGIEGQVFVYSFLPPLLQGPETDEGGG